MNFVVKVFSKIAEYSLALLGLICFFGMTATMLGNKKTFPWGTVALLLLGIAVCAGLSKLLGYAVKEDNQKLALIILGILSLPIIVICVLALFRAA